jgi:restriction system protein
VQLLLLLLQNFIYENNLYDWWVAKLNDVFHYPPDLFELVVQAIPLLNKSKDSVLLFFKGAGVDEAIFSDLTTIVRTDRNSITKFEICRKILERINQNSEKYLRQRREILKRITEFEAFSTCWEKDQYAAKGLVAEIQKVVNVKDSFTRMNQERDRETEKRRQEHAAKIEQIQKRKANLQSLKSELFSLFSETNHQKRGKDLERVLNKYFKEYEMLIVEDFKRRGEEGEGIIEQIDGIIELDNSLYFVEMKWKQDSIGNDDIYTHLGRIYHRTNAHGIFISASGYSPSGIAAAKEALIGDALIVFFDLKEFVTILEQEVDFKVYLRNRIQSTIIHKHPYKKD